MRAFFSKKKKTQGLGLGQNLVSLPTWGPGFDNTRVDLVFNVELFENIFECDSYGGSYINFFIWFLCNFHVTKPCMILKWFSFLQLLNYIELLCAYWYIYYREKHVDLFEHIYIDLFEYMIAMWLLLYEFYLVIGSNV